MSAGMMAGTCVALAAGWTAVLMAQGPDPAKHTSTDTVALIGCIAPAAPDADTGTSGATASARRFVLTKATAGTSPTSGTRTVADQKRTVPASQYRLEGSDSMLAPYVKHQVELTGTLTQPSGSTAASGANAPTLTVESVRMIAADCS